MDKADWIRLTTEAVERFRTPFYLFCPLPVEERVAQIEDLILQAGARTPVRQLLSLKTLPLPHLVREWCKEGRDVEVVSETELSMVLGIRGPTTGVVVNGVGKHHWLNGCQETGLTVNFDSLSEIRALLAQAMYHKWCLGLRVAVSNQIDPDFPDQPSQFGMTGAEVEAAVSEIRSEGADVEVLHFHLHSNVANVSDYHAALDECHELAQRLSIDPQFVDIGGGLPDFGVSQRNQSMASPDFLCEYVQFLNYASTRFAGLEALWVENGRYLLGPAGVLVVSVIDTKRFGEQRFIICDGGRTNQALESDWEEHPVKLMRETTGNLVPTTVCGPNCMAYDWIYKGPLPEGIQENDRIIYLNAGAYHLPWETRFCRGLCRVLWSHDGRTVEEIRPAERVEDVLDMWQL